MSMEKWLSYPVAHLTVVFSDRDVAGFMGVVADAADSLARHADGFQTARNGWYNA